MALKYVDYCSPFRLPCAGSARSEVVLCLQSGAVLADPLSPYGGLECAFADATICQFYSLTSCPSYWHYRFSYDEEILADPLVTLTTGDIVGVFCRDCQTDWVECQVGNILSNLCFGETETLTLELVDTCISGNVKVSEVEGNTITVNEDGLYSAGGGCPDIDCFVDSETVHFFLASEPDGISADVKISEDEGNIIEAHSDGLFATGGGGGGNDWHILGNSDIVDGTNFLGTTNAVDLTFRVNNLPTYKFLCTPFAFEGETPSICAFPEGNLIEMENTEDANWNGNLIAGGGGTDANANMILKGDFPGDEPSPFGYGSEQCSIGGGFSQVIFGESLGCGIWTGYDNSIYGSDYSVIAGGLVNSLGTDTDYYDGPEIFSYTSGCFIGGGVFNRIWESDHSNIVGGENNTIYAGPSRSIESSSIVGGSDNTIYNANTNSHRSFIGGGYLNLIQDSYGSFIGGGGSQNFLDPGNHIINSPFSSILGGRENSILDSDFCFIAEGEFNTLDTCSASTILNGSTNSMVGASNSCILGGANFTLGSNSVGYQSAGFFTSADVSAFSSIGYLGDIDLWLANTDNTARKLKFFSPNTDLDFSSSLYSSFQAQAQTGSIEYILPNGQASDYSVGDTLKIQNISGNVITLEWS